MIGNDHVRFGPEAAGKDPTHRAPRQRPTGAQHVDRPGIVQPGGPAVRAFTAIGWRWGGDYRTLKDYMHFSATGG
jgi:hypothetical protein